MPPKAGPDQQTPTPDQIGEKGAVQPKPFKERITAGARNLLNRFTPWINRPNPNSRKALEEIVTIPLKEEDTDQNHIQTEVKTEEQAFDQEKFNQVAVELFTLGTLQPPIEGEKDARARELITQNDVLLKQKLESYPSSVLSLLNGLLDMGYSGAEDAVFEFFKSNLSQIEKNIKPSLYPLGELGDKKESLIAISSLVIRNYQGMRDIAIGVLGSHFQDIATSLKSLPEWQTQFTSGYARALEALSIYGNSNVRYEAGDLLSETVKVRDTKGMLVLAELLKSRATGMRPLARFWLAQELQDYGLDPFDESEGLYQAWRKGGGFLVENYISDNFKQIRLLETKYKGITKFLVDEYGIKNFSRYPLYLLLRQYEQYQDISTPYGVVLYPSNDWNGAFSVHSGVLSIFDHQLKEQGIKINIKIVEAESKNDIARSLIKMRRHYGQGRKISFAIIGGHGTENSIRFGGTDEKHLLYAKDLMGHGVQRTSEFFEPDPQIILVSCSTGVQGGIGQRLSETLGAKVIAPEVPTNIKVIEPSMVNGKLALDAEYFEKNTARAYASGQIV